MEKVSATKFENHTAPTNRHSVQRPRESSTMRKRFSEAGTRARWLRCFALLLIQIGSSSRLEAGYG